MVVAIIGSRAYADHARVRAFVRALARKHPGAVVVSGGAAGVDRVAAEAARAAGLQVREVAAEWSRGRWAGVARNKAIVAEATHVVAFWNGSSAGTRDAINHARKLGRPCWVYGPSRGGDAD